MLNPANWWLKSVLFKDQRRGPNEAEVRTLKAKTDPKEWPALAGSLKRRRLPPMGMPYGYKPPEEKV